MAERIILRGGIYDCKGKIGVVVSNNIGNKHSPVVTVVYLNKDTYEPLFLFESVSKRKLKRQHGQYSNAQMDRFINGMLREIVDNLCGDIYYIGSKESDKEHCHNSVTAGERPFLVIAKKDGRNVGVMLTTANKKTLPTHVKVLADKPSIALCEHLFSRNDKNLHRYIRTCTEDEIEKLKKAFKISLQL